MDRPFFSGAKAAIPPCMGVIPVGISIGLLAVQAGLSALEATLMSALVMAGSSQLMAISMLSSGAAASAIILGTFFINLRHVVMSSSIMPRLRGVPLGRRLLGAFALCDESFAVCSLSPDCSWPFLMGANTVLYLSFVVSTLLGSLMTTVLPQIVIDSFGVAFYAAFLGLLIPSVKGRGRLTVLVLLTAALNWLLQRFLPASWSVILSMVLGAAVGVFLVDDEREAETT